MKRFFCLSQAWKRKFVFNSPTQMNFASPVKLEVKLYIPSTEYSKKLLSQPFGQIKDDWFLENSLNCLIIFILILIFRMYFHPNNFIIERNNPWFEPWFSMSLQLQLIAPARRLGQCLENLGYIILAGARKKMRGSQNLHLMKGLASS